MKHIDFIVFCLEEYRNARKLTGRQVITVFEKYGVYDFIERSYDALHTYGGDEIAWNIWEYIRNRGVVVA
jgi:hypothetical protein